MNTFMNKVLILGMLYGSAMIAMDNPPAYNRNAAIYSPADVRADQQKFESFNADQRIDAYVALRADRAELLDKVKKLEEENKSISGFLKARDHQSKSEKINHKTDLIVTGMGVALLTAIATVGIMTFLQSKSVSVPSK